MTSGGPWSVKGIDPKAREIAKDLARRSGMTLGEWINQMILLGDEEAEIAPESVRPPERPTERSPRRPFSGGAIYPPPSARLGSSFASGSRGLRVAASALRQEEEDEETHELGRVTAALERLSERIETAERRSTLAISGIDQSVAGALARLEHGEREQGLIASRVDEALQEVRETQARVGDRLNRLESDDTPRRSAEALKALEQALSRVANQLYESEGRTQAAFGEIRDDLGSLALKADRAERAAHESAIAQPVPEPLAAADPGPMVDNLVARVAERIEKAEARTSDAMRAMEASFAALDARLRQAETRLDEPEPTAAAPDPTVLEASFERLAAQLTERVEASRAELADSLNASAEARLQQIDTAVRDMTAHVEAAERRSAQAIEGMGREVLRVAELLGRRVTEADARAQAVVDRADSAQAQAIERLGEEITRISERLAERIGASERRSAQAIDEVGEQVARVTDKINQRYERSAADLAERLKQGESRTAQLLEETREHIDLRLAEAQRKSADQINPLQQALAGLTSRIDGLETASPFGAPVFEAPTFAAPVPSPASRNQALAAFPAEVFRPEPAAAARRPEEGRPAFDPFADFDVEAPAPASSESATAVAPVAAAAELAPPTAAAEPVDDPFTDFLADFPATESSADGPPAGVAASDPAPVGAEISSNDPFAPFAADLDSAVVEPTTADVAPASDAPPSSTRAMLDAARAAARAAAEPEAKPAARASRSRVAPLPEPLSSEVGARLERAPAPSTSGAGSPLRTALFVSAALATVSVGAWGYWWMNREPVAVNRTAPAAPAASSEGLPAPAAETAPAATAASGAGPTPAVAPAAAATPATRPSNVPAPVATSPAARPASATPAPSAAPPPVSPVATPAAPANDNAAYAAAVSQLSGGQRQQGLQALQMVAARGHAPAQFYLGKVYEEGRFGVPRDLAQARRWTERAAQGGETRAMHNLGLFYFEGTGGARDVGQAAQWFRRAADANLGDSQYNLARLYEQGLGVTRNPAEAYKWYLIAGANGDGDSRAAAQRLRNGLSPEARTAAERSAAAFRSQRGLSAPTLPAAAAPAAPAPAGPNATAAASDPATAAAQRGLSALGYYRGPADGVASPALRAAIVAYQRQQGVPVTGVADDALIARLSAPRTR